MSGFMENISVNDASRKLDRKTIERNRRIRMKALVLELTSLVPSQHFKRSKEMLSQKEQLDQAADYIKQLRERVEKLNRTKEVLKSKFETKGTANLIKSAIPVSRIPVVKIREIGSSLEVVLVSSFRQNFASHEVIRILQEQGVEVVSVSKSIRNRSIYHILHAQVKVTRFGVDTSIVYDRLQKLLNS